MQSSISFTFFFPCLLHFMLIPEEDEDSIKKGRSHSATPLFQVSGILYPMCYYFITA